MSGPRMRDHGAAHRAATPLELFFDLCFVVAVALLAAELHYALAEGRALEGLLRYLVLFAPVWWAWMSYTWFATAFDHDDPVTRVLTFAQMAGVIAVAATVHDAFDGDPVPLALAYVAMRTPLVVQWARAARADAAHRGFASAYALGTVAAQVLVLLGAALHLADGTRPASYALFAAAALVELATPTVAVPRSPGPVFHPGHVAERYGLFTIIVLGESVLAATIGLDEAGGLVDARAGTVVVAGLLVTFALWWLYFAALGTDALTRNRSAAFGWGYGHYLLFAAVAAVGAALQAQLEGVADAAYASGVTAGGAALLAALAAVLATLAWLGRTAGNPVRTYVVGAVLSGAAAVLALPALLGGEGSVLTTVLAAGLAVGVLVARLRDPARGGAAAPAGEPAATPTPG